MPDSFVRAEVKRIPSSVEGGQFETFGLQIPSKRHWQINGGIGGTNVFFYSPTNEELRLIIDVAQYELNRRRDAALAKVAEQYGTAAVSDCERAAIHEVVQ